MNWYKKAKEFILKGDDFSIPIELLSCHSISSKEQLLFKKIIKKIMTGQKKWTPQELELQQNYPELLEKILMGKYEMV